MNMHETHAIRSSRAAIAALATTLLLFGCDAGTGSPAAAEPDVAESGDETDATTGADVGAATPDVTGATDDAAASDPDVAVSEDAPGADVVEDTAQAPDTAVEPLPDYTGTGCYGQLETTQLFDHARMAFVPVETTCRGEGKLTQVYVDDELWNNGVTQEDVNTFLHRYELYGPETSVNPSTGALFVDEEVFGALRTESFPDGKLHIFILDTDGYGDAYVCPTEYGWCPYYCLHLDGVLMDLKEDYAISVAAHETFHIIHHYLDGNEDSWIDETLAEAAMLVNGYYTDAGWVADWLKHTDYNWGPGNTDHGTQHYGAFLLLGAYFWETGGPALLEAITAEPGNGWSGLDSALQSTGDPRTGWQLFLDFAVAIGVDDADLGYGFGFAALPPVAMSAALSAGGERADTVEPYGIDYVPVLGDGPFAVAVTSEVPVTVLGVIVGADVQVVDLSQGGALTVSSGSTPFLVVTARTAASYTITLD